MAPEIWGNSFPKICHIPAEGNPRRQVYKSHNRVNIEFIQDPSQSLGRKHFLLFTVALTYVNGGLSADDFVWKGSQLGHILQENISRESSGFPLPYTALYDVPALSTEKVSSLSVPHFLKCKERNTELQ